MYFENKFMVKVKLYLFEEKKNHFLNRITELRSYAINYNVKMLKRTFYWLKKWLWKLKQANISAKSLKVGQWDFISVSTLFLQSQIHLYNVKYYVKSRPTWDSNWNCLQCFLETITESSNVFFWPIPKTTGGDVCVCACVC